MNGTTTPIHRVLFLAHSHAFGPFRVGSHHYARTLAQRGFDVVHMSTPISLAHRALGRVSRAAIASVPRTPHRSTSGVTHVVPRTVLPRPYGRFRVARELERQGVAPDFDVVLIDQPLLWDDTVRALAPRLVYRPTDLYLAGVKARLQGEIAADADGVVATSEEVLRALGSLPVPTLTLENGVDAVRFAPAADDHAARPAVAVYVGALDERFDWTQLDRWARAHPEWRFIIAGPTPAPPSPPPSNVDVIGAIPYEALPALLNGARVGLLPLSDHPLNAGRSPMKLYEYLSAGLAVVSRATPVIRADEQAGLFTYRDATTADHALQRAMTHPSPNVPGTHRAARESWREKTDVLVSFLNALPSR